MESNANKDPGFEEIIRAVNTLLEKGHSTGEIGFALMFVASKMAHYEKIPIENFLDWCDRLFKSHMAEEGDYEESVDSYRK